MKPLRICFDFVSPYSYLAWTQVHALAERIGATVEPVPVLFAKVLAAVGSRAPVENPPRRDYLIKDVARTAALLGVPLWPPAEHPFNPLAALRMASLPLAADLRRRLIDALFAAIWARGELVADVAAVAAIARTAGVAEADLAAATEPEVKERLRAATEALVVRGGFGVPTLLVPTADGDELFFGLDSFPHIERFARGQDPLRPELLQRWRAIARST